MTISLDNYLGLLPGSQRPFKKDFFLIFFFLVLTQEYFKKLRT